MSLHPEQSDDLNPACAFVRDNADAFALAALSVSESRRLLDHLNEHPECLAYFDEAISTVRALAYSMPLVAAPDLAVKLKLFDRIAAESQPAPATPSKVQVSNEIVTALAQGSPAASAQVQAPEVQRSWVQYLSTALVAPLAIALVVVSLWAYNMDEELDSMRNATAESAGTSSNSIEMLTMETSDESSARGSLGAMPDQTSAVLLAWDLDPDEKHEVWCEESDGQKTMVSALDVGEDGNAMQTIKFPGPIDGYKRIFVAGSEPDGTDAPELILTIPEKVGKDEDEEPAATP